MNFIREAQAKIFSPDRQASLDYWRAAAILLVVFWHFFPIPVNLGLLGVQIFFVLSGYLVSRSLFEGLNQGQIQFQNFYRSRFFRILPSYYAFLILGSLLLLASLPLGVSGVLIPEEHVLSYYLFFKNYNTSNPSGFSHVWTLCVEEHFYLTVPLLFFAHIFFFKGKYLRVSLAGLIALQLVIRYIGYTRWFESRGIFFSDPAASHNNFDALLWGVLLRSLDPFFKNSLRSFGRSFVLGSGALLLAGSFFYVNAFQDFLYFMVFFKFVNALAIALLIGASLHWNFSRLQSLRYVAYYSYNWYLWHMVSLVLVTTYGGREPLHFAVYILVGFGLAFLATHLIEQPVTRWSSRKKKGVKVEPQVAA